MYTAFSSSAPKRHAERAEHAEHAAHAAHAEVAEDERAAAGNMLLFCFIYQVLSIK